MTRKFAQKIAIKKRTASAKRMVKSANRLKREQAHRHPAFETPHVARRGASKPAPHAVTIDGGERCPRGCRKNMQRYRRPDGWVARSNAPFNAVTIWDRCRCGHIRIIARNDERPIT
jgi:hypothetical protein